MKITPTSLTISQLLGTQNEQYVVPSYQRRYSWTERQLVDLLTDVDLIEGADTHLLGSIVCLADTFKAGINRLEVVDGQQRLTSLSILLRCLSDRLSAVGETGQATALVQLLQAKALGKSPEPKVILDSLDAAEFKQLMAGSNASTGGNPSLRLAFEVYRTWATQKSPVELETLAYRLLSQVLVIRLDVSDAKDAFKLFETINNRGLRLSSTDIIKNFLLGNAARFGAEPLAEAKHAWSQVVASLDGVNSEAFFRHYLMAKYGRRITRSFVIGRFKQLFMATVAEAANLPDQKVWVDGLPAAEAADDDDGGPGDSDIGEAAVPLPVAGKPAVAFADFLHDLTGSADAYSRLVRCNTGVVLIDRRLRDLRLVSGVQTYGFLMRLRLGGCDDSTFLAVLQLTIAFLIRRHTCRMRANDNETAFAKLCGEPATDPIPAVRDVFRSYTPADDKFRADFAAFEFTGALIDRARYCLERLNQQAIGKYEEMFAAGTEANQVEHIVPQTIRTKSAKAEFGDWPTYLGAGWDAKHGRYVSRIGNLTLLAKELNLSASDNPYARKVPDYRQSALPITNSLPDTYPDFRFAQIDERSSRFADQAVTIWPVP